MGTLNLQDCSAFETHAVGQEQVLCMGIFTLGSSGAVASSIVSDPAMTLGDDSATGVHALTYPKCPTATIKVQLQSASLTISEAILTAKDTTAGTATIKTAKAGTLAQGASGNVIMVVVYGKVT
jgi:hypothetical protein